MSTGAIIAIILLVLGVIISNLMLLKYSARFKFPSLPKDTKNTNNNKAIEPTSEQDE